MSVEKLTEILGVENKPFLETLRFCTYGVFLYLDIDVDIVAILSILMIFDMCFGVLKSLRLGSKFQFKTMMWGFVTKLSLLMIPMTVALMGKALGRDFVWTVDLAIKALVVNEGLSILANILSVKQRKNIENFDFISLFIEHLQEYFINKMKSIFNGKRNN